MKHNIKPYIVETPCINFNQIRSQVIMQEKMRVKKN